MNFNKLASSVVLALSCGSVASAQWGGSNLSVGIGGGWSKTSWSGNGGQNGGRNGSVENSYINGGIGFNTWSGGGGGYGGGGYGGGGYGGYAQPTAVIFTGSPSYGGGYGCGGGGYVIPVVVPYSPFTNTWGNPCYPVNPYGGYYANPNRYDQFFVR